MGHRFIETCSPDPPEGMKCKECDATAVPLIDLDAPPVPQEAAPRIEDLELVECLEPECEPGQHSHMRWKAGTGSKATAPDWAMRVARQFCDEAFTEHNPTLVETWRNRLAALIREAGSERERDLTDLLTRLVAKLKVILPKVDGIIALQVVRAGVQIYDGPTLADELAEASRLLGGESK